MKNSKLTFAQKLRRNSVVRGPTYRHDPLLINSLAIFNFRPPIRLEMPGERLARSGAFPEVIRDGETGLLVPPDDPEALAKALQRLIADAELRRRLGDAARAHVAKDFTVERMADRFVAALI